MRPQYIMVVEKIFEKIRLSDNMRIIFFFNTDSKHPKFSSLSFKSQLEKSRHQLSESEKKAIGDEETDLLAGN